MSNQFVCLRNARTAAAERERCARCGQWLRAEMIALTG